MRKLVLFIWFLICLVAIGNFAYNDGRVHGRRQMQKEAIAGGAAKRVVNPTNGVVTFTWITNP